MPTLQWIGKEKVVSHHHDVAFRTLEHQYGFRAEQPDDTSETFSGNKIIHGDNLEVLKALLPEYEGRVDCVYIDPPYNTGNEKWVYNDNVNDPQIRRWLNQVVGAEGEDLSRHDKWLCMMYPRLTLLRQLLSNDGTIFVSIGDDECAHLRLVMDEIFGRQCFVGDIIWQKAYSPRNDAKGIPTEAEHLMVFSKRPGWQPNKLERTEEMDSKYKNPDNDTMPWTSSDAFASDAATHQGMVYAIQHPFTGELIYPYQGAHWRYEQNAMLSYMEGWCPYELRDLHDDGRRAEVCGVPKEQVRPEVKAIMLKEPLDVSREKAQAVYNRGQWPRFYFTSGGKGGIRRKTYLSNVEGKLPTNLWLHTEVGHTDEAKKELKEYFGGKSPFDTPKPTRLIERILEIATHEDSIILDAFAGSGTTMHAALRLNKRDHGIRKTILVELMDYAECITAERVRKVMAGYDYQGTKKETLYAKKLTVTALKKMERWLGEANNVMEMFRSDYDSVKMQLSDNTLSVVGSKVIKGHRDGLGGQFDFYELGQRLFTDDGNINEEVGEEKIRQYIYYTETHDPLTRRRDAKYPYLLDYKDGTGYFFFYEQDRQTCLSLETLAKVVKKADRYVVYADTCLLSPEMLRRLNIVFKKIPRDINRF